MHVNGSDCLKWEEFLNSCELRLAYLAAWRETGMVEERKQVSVSVRVSACEASGGEDHEIGGTDETIRASEEHNAGGGVDIASEPDIVDYDSFRELEFSRGAESSGIP